MICMEKGCSLQVYLPICIPVHLPRKVNHGITKAWKNLTRIHPTGTISRMNEFLRELFALFAFSRNSRSMHAMEIIQVKQLLATRHFFLDADTCTERKCGVNADERGFFEKP